MLALPEIFVSPDIFTLPVNPTSLLNCVLPPTTIIEFSSPIVESPLTDMPPPIEIDLLIDSLSPI